MSLGDRVAEIATLHGQFRLRSGLEANVYFDKYQFEARPDLLAAIIKDFARLVPKDTEVLAGLELGGVPLAVALGLHSGMPMCFVRKTRKTYGTCRIAEGVDVRSKRVCVIEDVITTGGQVVESVQALREEGAIVTAVCCVILRAASIPTALTDVNVRVLPLLSFNGDKLVEAVRL